MLGILNGMMSLECFELPYCTNDAFKKVSPEPYIRCVVPMILSLEQYGIPASIPK